MTTPPRKHADDLRAASALAVDAVQRVTQVVEAMHHTIGSGPAVLGAPLAVPMGLYTRLVYGSIRGMARLVGTGLDVILEEVAPLLGESTPGRAREAAIAVLNGVIGDYLELTQNPLAITMGFRAQGRPLQLERGALQAALPGAGRKVLVLVHGSSASDLQWQHQGHDHGAVLARDLGFTPIALQYNSGLHISTNGHRFAALLEQLLRAWPHPVDELALVGHSMGGLLARSACVAGEAAGHQWRQKLTRLACLGSPHQGAPLERGGAWVDVLLGISRYSAPLASLGKLRSAGITDLRYGNVLDAQWEGRDRFGPSERPPAAVPLPQGVRCFAVAGSLSPTDQPSPASDGLVPVDSALGRHRDFALRLDFPPSHQYIAWGSGHLGLLSRPDVAAMLVGWLK